MAYIILKSKKLFNMLHQKSKMILFCFVLLTFSSCLFVYHLNAFNWKKIIFLLNIGTIKDKDGLLTLDLDLSILGDMPFVKGLISTENPLWPVLVKFSQSCILGRGEEGISSDLITFLFEWLFYSFSQNMIL